MKFITFDIEDWFHILDHPETANPSSWDKFESRIDHGVGLILDLMDKHDLKGTFFCLGWIAEKYPHIIKRIDAAGHHIGTHSYYHQLAYEQTEDEYRKDLSDSIKILSDLTGKTIDAYRAPGFSIKESNLWAFDVMAFSSFAIVGVFSPYSATKLQASTMASAPRYLSSQMSSA